MLLTTNIPQIIEQSWIVTIHSGNTGIKWEKMDLQITNTAPTCTTHYQQKRWLINSFWGGEFLWNYKENLLDLLPFSQKRGSCGNSWRFSWGNTQASIFFPDFNRSTGQKDILLNGDPKVVTNLTSLQNVYFYFFSIIIWHGILMSHTKYRYSKEIPVLHIPV